MSQEIYDVQLYKFSKQVVKDLEGLLKVLLLFEKHMTPYAKYVNALDVMASISENKRVIEAQLNKYKAIEKKKGRVI